MAICHICQRNVAGSEYAGKCYYCQKPLCYYDAATMQVKKGGGLINAVVCRRKEWCSEKKG